MFYYLCIFFISLHSYIHSSELFNPEFFRWCQETRVIRPQPFDALINLGDNCQVAYQMRLHGIRNESLPFDWIITPFESLYKILDEKFKQFLNPQNLSYIKNDHEKYIYDSYYEIKFLHDFRLKDEFLLDFDTVKTTYTRRVTRFLNILQESKHALFIRKNITKEQAIELRALLQKLCPENDFLILAVSTNQNMKIDWNLDHIKNIHLNQSPSVNWKGDLAAWKTVFLAVGLNLSDMDEVMPIFK